MDEMKPSQDLVAVLVLADHAPGHGAPDLAEALDHLAPVRRVRLRIDHHAAAQVDEPRVGVAHPVAFVQDGKTVVADLVQFHRRSRWPVSAGARGTHP